MKNKKYIVFGNLILIMVLLAMSLVSAEINLSDPLAYQRHLKILNEFDKGNEWVPIGVHVFSEEMREDVISSLSESEFRDLRREYESYVFSGEVTKQGLDKLVDNPNVKWINLQESLSPKNNKSINDIDKDLDKATKEKKWILILVGVIVVLILIGVGYAVKKR